MDKRHSASVPKIRGAVPGIISYEEQAPWAPLSWGGGSTTEARPWPLHRKMRLL